MFEEGIELSWVPPVHSSKDVHYFISSIRDQVTNTINTTSNIANLTGLDPGMTYNITVVAINSAGMREWAGEEIYTHNPSLGSNEGICSIIETTWNSAWPSKINCKMMNVIILMNVV